MNGSGFGAAAFTGFVISVIGAGLFVLASVVFKAGVILPWLLPLLVAMYLIWLLSSHRSRAGALLVLLGWGVLAVALLGVGAGMLTSLALYSVLIWLVRSCVRYRKIVSITADGVMSAAAMGVALAVAGYSQSVFLALWSYFLLQALVFLLPGQRAVLISPANPNHFSRARSTAEVALRRINNLN